MFIVTGGAGFIGSNLIQGLNKKGITDILVIDSFKNNSKFRNLVSCKIADFIDKEAFRLLLENKKLNTKIDFIYHQGACSNTTEPDGNYMMDNNYTYSKILLHYALENKIPFVYASSAAVYGNSQNFAEEPQNEKPVNIYGYSKLLFDQYVRRFLSSSKNTIVGLRYFNVYGPHEIHKGKMASTVFQLYQQLENSGEMKLFEGTEGYAHGEQRRDFIYVADVVNCNLFFLEGNHKGIYNLGTGQSRSFNDIAKTLISLAGKGRLSYFPFPESLKGKYQSFTQANISSLRKIYPSLNFTNLEEGISKYYSQLIMNPISSTHLS